MGARVSRGLWGKPARGGPGIAPMTGRPVCRLRSCDGREVPRGLIGPVSHAVCSEVLDNVDNPSKVIRQGVGLPRPGRRLLGTVPGGPRPAYDRHSGHPDHFTPPMLASHAAVQGLDVASLVGAGWPFFNTYRLVVIARAERPLTDAASSGRFARGGPGFASLLLRVMQHSRWGARGAGRCLARSTAQ